jgi:hypothetical protein
LREFVKSSIETGVSRITASVMTRAEQRTQDRYDALMFAKSPQAARNAAYALIRDVLGDDASGLTFEESLRRTCRKLRPSVDVREQVRFENEFIELALAPTGGLHNVAA